MIGKEHHSHKRRSPSSTSRAQDSDDHVNYAERDESWFHKAGDGKKTALAIVITLGLILLMISAYIAANHFIRGDEDGEDATNIEAPESVDPDPNDPEAKGTDAPRGSLSGDNNESDDDASSDDNPEQQEDIGPPDNHGGSSVGFTDMEFPNTVTTAGDNIFLNKDTLTDDRESVNSIIGLLHDAMDQAANANVGAGEGGPEDTLDDENEDGISLDDVANWYFYNNTNVAYTLHEGAHNGWVVYDDQVYVFDANNPGVKKIAFTVGTPEGEPMYFVTGYYDPVVDSIKVASANLTEAGRAAI